MPPDDGGTFGCYLLFFLFSHCWFAMPQLVLQADCRTSGIRRSRPSWRFRRDFSSRES